MKRSRIVQAEVVEMQQMGDPVEDEDDSPSQDMAGGDRPAATRRSA